MLPCASLARISYAELCASRRIGGNPSDLKNYSTNIFFLTDYANWFYHKIKKRIYATLGLQIRASEGNCNNCVGGVNVLKGFV